MSIIRSAIHQIGAPAIRLKQSTVSLGKTFGTVASTISSLRRYQKSTDPDIVAGREIQDDGERFEYLCKAKHLNQEELTIEHHQYIVHQRAYMLEALLALALTIFFITQTHSWMSAVLTALTYLGFNLFVLLELKMALHATQYSTRRLIRWNEFAGRKDFYRRVLKPW